MRTSTKACRNPSSSTTTTSRRRCPEPTTACPNRRARRPRRSGPSKSRRRCCTKTLTGRRLPRRAGHEPVRLAARALHRRGRTDLQSARQARRRSGDLQAVSPTKAGQLTSTFKNTPAGAVRTPDAASVQRQGNKANAPRRRRRRAAANTTRPRTSRPGRPNRKRRSIRTRRIPDHLRPERDAARARRGALPVRSPPSRRGRRTRRPERSRRSASRRPPRRRPGADRPDGAPAARRRGDALVRDAVPDRRRATRRHCGPESRNRPVDRELGPRRRARSRSAARCI